MGSSLISDVHDEIDAATARLLQTVRGLTDDDARTPSRLPGWTKGHVLSHLGDNAGALMNLLTWARTGVETPQYPSVEARNAAIEAGAGRTAAEHLAHLEDGAARWTQAVQAMPERAWSATVQGLRPPAHPAWYVLVRRLREVEVHHVDLGLAYGTEDWPDAFVARELSDSIRSMPEAPFSRIHATDTARVWDGLGSGPVVYGSERQLLAWLSGRAEGEGLRVDPDGPLPAAPPWLAGPAPTNLPAGPPPAWPSKETS